MGQLVRDTDWSATPLGAYADWPQSLRSSLSLVLNTKGIAALYWGRSSGSCITTPKRARLRSVCSRCLVSRSGSTPSSIS